VCVCVRLYDAHADRAMVLTLVFVCVCVCVDAGMWEQDDGEESVFVFGVVCLFLYRGVGVTSCCRPCVYTFVSMCVCVCVCCLPQIIHNNPCRYCK